jgi:hypothetical protein
MKRKMKMKSLIALLASLVVAGAAQAADVSVVAGWDFSQYWAEGTLIVDDSFVNKDTLDANYSDFDPTFGAGAESAAFGTLYFNGSHGSTNVDENGFPPAFGPTANSQAGASLGSNLSAPQNGVPVGDVPFDTHNVLAAEGQAYQEYLAMTAISELDIVFEANLTSAGLTASAWQISFAAQTFSGNETEVTVEFSTDGMSYSSFGSVTVDANDMPYLVDLGTDITDQAFVRLGFDPSSLTGGQPVIDNVAIMAIVPEPSTFFLLSLGLAGLGAFGRHRS